MSIKTKPTTLFTLFTISKFTETRAYADNRISNMRSEKQRQITYIHRNIDRWNKKGVVDQLQ